MKKASKTILGTLGLIAVAIVTAIATQLPSYATSSSDVNIKVNVTSNNPEINIQRPLDNADFFGNSLPISVLYSKATKINYTITYHDEHDLPHTINLPAHNISSTPNSGVHDWNLTFATLPHFGKYILRASLDNHPTAEDSITFNRLALSAQQTGTSDHGTDDGDSTTGDPLFNVVVDPIVATIGISIIDPSTGNLLSCTAQPNPTYHQANTLPNPLMVNYFSTCNLPAGRYLVRFSPNVLDLNSGNYVDLYIDYRPTKVPTPAPTPVPQVPNTGGSILTGLNLSRGDYLMSSLLVFGASVVFGFFLLRRPKTSKRVRRR